jgi:hypothetical protein
MVGREYDPCFRPEFQAQNPDVVGMIAIAAADRSTQWESSGANASDENKLGAFREYFSWYLDSHSLMPGIPEIVLTPHKRALKTKRLQVVTNLNDFLRENKDEFNYLPFYTIERTNQGIKELVDGLLSAKGLKYKTSDIFYHAKINKETGFMQIVELSDPFPMSDTVRFNDPAFRFVRPPPTVTR